MNLSNEEKQFYEDTFSKLTQNNPSIKEQSCRPLLNRGIGDSAISDQIWALVSDGSSKQVLKKKDVFRMLKYIAAYQNGYQIENLTLKDLPEMSVPNLSKKKKKNRGGELAKAPIQNEIRNENQVCPQIVEQSPEKDQPQDASPTRASVMSCPSTEDPVSERHISPDKNHGKELVVEEKPEMLTEQLEKEHQAQEALPIEQESQEPPVEKFESLQNIVENDANVPENVEEPETVEVVNEEQPVNEYKPQTFEAEEPSVEKFESPQNIVENVVNVPENVEEAETIEVINEEKPASEEKPQAFEEEAVVVNVQQDEFPAIHIHNEEGLELTKQLNLIKNAQTGTLEDVQHNDDDERRSKGSETSSRASIKSHRSHMSVDSAHRQAMNLLKYNQYLEQNQKFQVEIRDTITYNSGFLGYGTYTSYLIRSKYPDSATLETERRFSDFDWLDSYLRSHLPYKGLVFPTLPEKKSIGNNEPGFIQQRKAELDRYLKEISRHKVLSQDPILRTFLGEKAKEGFQSLKDKIPVNGLALPELDWLKIKEVCEYAMASVKVKLQKDSLPNDWKDSNEKIYDVLRIDGAIKKLLKTLQKREELYKTVKTMNNNLNVVHMKIMNRVEKEAYYAIGSLSSLMFAQARNMNDEAVITENLKKQIKVFRAKIDGCKKSYALLISTLQEIGTNKELHKNKQGKLFEYKAEKNMNGIAALTKELGEIEKKVETLEKETGIIKDNLDLEADYLVELFDVFLPDALSFFNSQQAEHIERVTKTWEGISQE